MSFTRMRYDECEAQTHVNASVAPGVYQVNTPAVSCEPCFPCDPNVRPQSVGVYHFQGAIVDTGSQLSNIHVPYSRRAVCTPVKKPSVSKHVGPFSQFAETGQDCFRGWEDTRSTHNKCTLRGFGIERWDCVRDPQADVMIPFECNVSNRNTTKDKFCAEHKYVLKN